MSKFQNNLINTSAGDDIVAGYRKRIWTLFGAVCLVVFLPGSIFVFLTGYTALSIAVLCMLGALALNGYSAIRNKSAHWMMALFVVSLILVVGLCILQRGVFGVFWTFPALLFISFLAYGWTARIYTAIFFLCVSLIMLFTLDLEVSTRAITGLLVTTLITNIFLEMIDKLQKHLVEQSGIDPLTGALNRREMDLVLRDALDRKRRRNTRASMLVIDIDEFKSVNDTYGHAAGDRVLRETALLIQSRCRHMDKLFRIGGEEFMLVLPDTFGDGAARLAEELRLLVSEGNFIEDREITISIGVSELNAGESIDEWIKRGDDALYSAKCNGRNQVVESLVTEIAMHVIEPFPIDSQHPNLSHLRS